jgi:hypothetical protein
MSSDRRPTWLDQLLVPECRARARRGSFTEELTLARARKEMARR